MALVDWWLDRMLQLTYSSERGAALAYQGHARAVRDAGHRTLVAQVERDEWHHRERLLVVMRARGVAVLPWLDAVFGCIGSTVGMGCQVWPEWASALGASWFESNGVSEYRRLSFLARRSGNEELIELFDDMAGQEQSHLDLFRRLAWDTDVSDLLEGLQR